MIKNVAFPFHFDGRGRTAQADHKEHIRQMIEQVLFTNAGERVNRPDFGSGLLQLQFAANSRELAAALQFTMRAALQKYLDDLIEVQELEVIADQASLRVEVRYIVRRSQEEHAVGFMPEGGMQ